MRSVEMEHGGDYPCGPVPDEELMADSGHVLTRAPCFENTFHSIHVVKPTGSMTCRLEHLASIVSTNYSRRVSKGQRTSYKASI